MRKIIALAICLAIAGIAIPVNAAETATVTLTVTPTGTLSISVTPASYDFGNLAYGSEASTSGGYFNITNDGTLACKVQISAGNTANWTLGSSPGYNIFVVNATTSTWASAITLTTTAQDFVASLNPGSWQTFDVGLKMPTSGDTTAQQTITITLQAVSL